MSENNDKIIEVSAVIIFDDASRMLTVRKHGTTRFMHPGGKPEPGESPVEAAAREVKEELGLTISPEELESRGVHTAPAANEEGFAVRAHLFEYTTTLGHRESAQLSPAAEIEELRWLDFSPAAALPQDLAPLVTQAVLPLYGRREINAVAVYTGARPGNDPQHAELARQLGSALAQYGITLVYGGGKVGLMGEVADACLAAGGDVIGVIPQDLMDRELGHPGLQRLEVVGSMHERKQRMVELADAYVALPGGAGTLDELFEAWTWQQLGIHSNPIALLGAAYWQPMMTMLHGMVEAGFVRGEDAESLLVEDEATRLLDRLRSWIAPAPKWR